MSIGLRVSRFCLLAVSLTHLSLNGCLLYESPSGNQVDGLPLVASSQNLKFREHCVPPSCKKLTHCVENSRRGPRRRPSPGPRRYSRTKVVKNHKCSGPGRRRTPLRRYYSPSTSIKQLALRVMVFNIVRQHTKSASEPSFWCTETSS